MSFVSTRNKSRTHDYKYSIGCCMAISEGSRARARQKKTDRRAGRPRRDLLLIRGRSSLVYTQLTHPYPRAFVGNCWVSPLPTQGDVAFSSPPNFYLLDERTTRGQVRGHPRGNQTGEFFLPPSFSHRRGERVKRNKAGKHQLGFA